MRTFVLCSALLLGLATTGTAAPALGDKPKWEYAELTFRNAPGRPAFIDDDGKEVPAVPASVAIKWITGAGEVDVKGWDELADKLKAPALKKGSAAYLKIQILNYLGSEGWELMEQQATGTAAALFDGPSGRRPGGAAGGGPGGRGPGAADRGTGADLPGYRPFSPATGTWLLKRRVP